MTYFKEFRRGGRLYLSVVDVEDALAKSGSSFVIHRFLCMSKAT